MAIQSWYSAFGPLPEGLGTDAVAPPLDALPADQVGVLAAHRADCCIAAAAFRVVLPATAARHHSAELLLCGHHYRQSRAALAAAHAPVFNGDGTLISADVD